jgi:hypothetical protein
MTDRIVRTPLPVGLIREMDELILGGQGGFETRTEFILEAIRNLVTELRFDVAPELRSPSSEHPGAPVLTYPPNPLLSAALATGPERVDQIATPSTRLGPLKDAATLGWSSSAIRSVAAPETGLLETGIEVVDHSQPLYGLHNRDYPSIWAAHFLAVINDGYPVPLDDFVTAVVEAAWVFGERLERIGQTMHAKTTALFPTNKEKPQSAADGFKVFAVGTATKARGQDGWKAEGPLFTWHLAHLQDRDGRIFVGPSTELFDLLRGLDGITVQEPHLPSEARAFLAHLRASAPGDWLVLNRILRFADEAPRATVLERLTELRPDWSPAQRETNATGFIARLREWGLLEPKQDKGIYRATDFGRELLEEWKETE